MITKRDSSDKLTGSQTIDDKDLDAGLFTLRYISNAPSPIFTLEHKKSREYLANASNRAGFLEEMEQSDPLAQWIVLPHKTSGSTTLYYICCPAGEHPIKTISSRQIGKHKEFVLEDMSKGHTMHQWQFIEERGN